MDEKKVIAPDSAAAVWLRAAQLQSEAAQRLEERSRALSANTESASLDPSNLTLEEVRAAAAEVGIAPEFIALAINELNADPAGALHPEQQDAATRFLGTAERMLEVSRIVDRPATEVYTALQRVMPAHPWLLGLRDVAGDPLAGGALVFNLPEWSVSATQYTKLAYYATAVDVQQVQILLRPTQGSSGQACEIVLRAGLQRSVRRNYRFGKWGSGIVGLIGAGGGGALGAAVLGAGAVAVALPAIAGGVLVGGGAALGYRALYRHYLRLFTGTLNEMLASVAVHVKTGGTFSPPATVPFPKNGVSFGG